MEDPSHLYELLELLESGILSLEKDRTADPAVAIHRLFQSAHNLKSGLAMAGLERASKRFHGLEDGLDDIRRGRSRWTAAWADAVFDTVDRIRDCLDRGADGDLDPEFQVPDSPATSAPGSVPTPALSPEEREAAMGLPPGHNLFRIEKLFLPGLTREEFEGHLIYEDIRDSGTLVSVRPDWEGYRQAPGETVVRFLFSSAQTAEMLGNLFFDPLIPVTIPDPPAGSVPGYRLLIVDDDRVVANLVAKQIAAYGTAVLAPDGVAGLETFRREFDAGRTFDVVILDLEMPGLDGHQTLQGIRDHEESRGIHGLDRCLVFMNTSNPDLAKVKASFRLQADRYFIKPLSVDQIKKGLEDCLPWLENRRRGA